MKNKLSRKIISLILATIILLSAFTIPSSAFSLKVGNNPYIIFSKWHLCILKDYTEPDCENNGYVIYKCVFCKYTKSTIKEAYGHLLYESETVNPTCENDGYITYNCENCDYTEKEIISKTGHEIIEIEKVDATCLEDGYIKFVCKNCDYTEEETISKTGHEIIEIEKVDATCLEDGYTKNICENCDYTEIVTHHKTGHSIVVDTLAESCETDGYIKRKCENCDYNETEIIQKRGHSFIEIEREEATCELDGYVYYECEYCDAYDYMEFEPTGHTVVYIEAVEPTCTQDGCTEGKYCSKCNNIFKRSEILPASHTYKILELTKSTTEQDGYCKKECTVCGHVEEETIVKPANVVCSKGTTYYYTGYEIKPEVEVHDANGDIIPASEYVVAYYDNIENGKGGVVVVFKGEKYEGTLETKFLINHCPAITVSKVRNRGFKVVFSVTPAVDCIQIQYYDSPSKAKNIVQSINYDSPKTLTYTTTNLNVSAYTVMVRVRINGRWSNWGKKMINIQNY